MEAPVATAITPALSPGCVKYHFVNHFVNHSMDHFVWLRALPAGASGGGPPVERDAGESGTSLLIAVRIKAIAATDVAADGVDPASLAEGLAIVAFVGNAAKTASTRRAEPPNPAVRPTRMALVHSQPVVTTIHVPAVLATAVPLVRAVANRARATAGLAVVSGGIARTRVVDVITVGESLSGRTKDLQRGQAERRASNRYDPEYVSPCPPTAVHDWTLCWLSVWRSLSTKWHDREIIAHAHPAISSRASADETASLNASVEPTARPDDSLRTRSNMSR